MCLSLNTSQSGSNSWTVASPYSTGAQHQADAPFHRTLRSLLYVVRPSKLYWLSHVPTKLPSCSPALSLAPGSRQTFTRLCSPLALGQPLLASGPLRVFPGWSPSRVYSLSSTLEGLKDRFQNCSRSPYRIEEGILRVLEPSQEGPPPHTHIHSCADF